MFRVYSSNRLESLLDSYIEQLATPADPFIAPQLVVQNAGMGRWINQQIAEKQGVCANITIASPGNFLAEQSRLAGMENHAAAARSKDWLGWRLFTLLPTFIEDAEFSELRRYLAQDQTGSALIQLSRRIAAVFDRYLIYRPDWIAAWERGEHRHWQAVLWRAVVADGGVAGWGDALQQLINCAGSAESSRLEQVAPVAVFGVSALPQVHIDMLAVLARFNELSLYYLNPCREYWADLVDDRGLAQRRARARKAGLDDPTGLLDIGNPLLASWGLAGQTFLDQLLEAGVDDSEQFVAPGRETLLTNVQSDILELCEMSATPVVIDEADNSLQVHSAHSRLREVQILHDQLLALFQQLPGLQPRDIIVMAPDIDEYAPLIEATFSTAAPPLRIPWTVADRRVRSEQLLYEVLLQLLALPESRFEATELLSFLEVPALARRMGLPSGAITSLRRWVVESGIRWSRDAEMREQFSLPAQYENSWLFGLQRLFAGFALPVADQPLFAGVAPYRDVEGVDAELLSVLQRLCDRCAEWQQRLTATQSLTGWLEQLDQLIETFLLADDEEQYALRQLRGVLQQSVDDAVAAGLQREVGRELIVELVREALEDNSSARRFLAGGVTFSNMVPMRSIPFRVVCLIGMNAQSFPRNERPDSFDLVAQKPRRGDRHRGSDDRYLFLETLMSARDVMYLSYVGNDARDNSEKAAATVVCELHDTVNAGYCKAGASGDKAVAPALRVVGHPLQSFSLRYFNKSDSALHNFRPHAFRAAADLLDNQTSAVEPTAFFQTIEKDKGESDAVPETIQLGEFQRWLIDPAADFLRRQLQLVFYRDDDLPVNSEPFAFDGLGRWQLNQEILSLTEARPESHEQLQVARALGIVPAGFPGAQAVRQSQELAQQHRYHLLQLQAGDRQSLDVDIHIAGTRLVGELEQLYSDGLVGQRLGTVRATDMLPFWVSHLLLCTYRSEARSSFLGRDEIWEIAPVSSARDILQQLLILFLEGLHRPVPFFPQLAFERMQLLQAGDSKSMEKVGKLERQWREGKAFESAREPVKTIWQGRNPLTEECRQIARQVFQPLLDHSIVHATQADV